MLRISYVHVIIDSERISRYISKFISDPPIMEH
jgi:hypothetical protein